MTFLIHIFYINTIILTSFVLSALKCFQNGGRLSPSSPSSAGGPASGSVSSVSSAASLSGLLDEQQVTKIGDVAEMLVRSLLPTLSPFDLKNMKKRLPKEMEVSLMLL